MKFWEQMGIENWCRERDALPRGCAEKSFGDTPKKLQETAIQGPKSGMFGITGRVLGEC
jgi:hypothetical protein